MKVKISFSLLFLFAFVFAAGLVSGDAVAGKPCLRSQCLCELYCSTDMGELCKYNPLFPYYLYEVNCEIKPGENCQSCEEFERGWVGCCRFPMP